MQLGTYLKQARENASLTLRKVEKQAGISNSYLSQIENNKIKNPSPKLLFSLAELYHVEYDFLLELAGYPTLSKKEKTPYYRRGSILNDISEDEEKELADYLRFLRSKRRKK